MRRDEWAVGSGQSAVKTSLVSRVEGIVAIRNYRDLIAWQKAMDMIEDIYRSSKEFPRDEMYGLTSQIRRAAVSVASNIAEGEGRDNPREFAHFLRIANGSLREAETQTLIAERLKYLTAEQSAQIMDRTSEVGRILTGLRKSLNV